MAKTRAERITNIEAEIQQLENQRKKLLQEQKLSGKTGQTASASAWERKDRTNRLCKRMGHLESLLPETIALTEEQFKAFLDKTVANSFGRRILAEIKSQPQTKPAEKQGFLDLPYAQPAKQTTPDAKPGDDADDSGDEYEDTEESG